jgi:hypothetical protein
MVALAAAGLTGGLSPLGVEGLPDPGALTRVGLPTVQAIRDLAAMVTVGVLVVAAVCVPPSRVAAQSRLSPAQQRLVGCAQLSATAWVVTGLLLVALVYSDASGTAVGAPGFASQAVFFALEFELGRYGLWGTAGTAAVAVACALVRRIGGAGTSAALALVALWPMALTRARSRQPQPRRGGEPPALPPRRHQRLARRAGRAGAGATPAGRRAPRHGARVLDPGRVVPGARDALGVRRGVATPPVGGVGAVLLRCDPRLEACRRDDAGCSRLVAPASRCRHPRARLGPRILAPRRRRAGSPRERSGPRSRARPHGPDCRSGRAATSHRCGVAAGEAAARTVRCPTVVHRVEHRHALPAARDRRDGLVPVGRATPATARGCVVVVAHHLVGGGLAALPVGHPVRRGFMAACCSACTRSNT